MTVELDKLDIHNRQQLSALMDGELAPDEARFLLRRLQHDDELGSAWERWQLCGDVLRGQARAPAPAGFAQRVALAVAAEPHRHATNENAAATPRGRLMRWGGGALAASVALMAFLIARPQLPEDTSTSSAPAIAATTPAPAVDEDATLADAGGTLADAGSAEVLASAAATVAVASVPRRDATTRRSATRTQQAARSSMARAAREPQRAVASAAPVAPPVNAVAGPGTTAVAAARVNNPFSSSTPVSAPQARPWPRSTLPYASNAAGSLSTGYSSDSGARTFYPFDPAQSTPAAQP
ncbi:sigma-E factor negative regulatory protein [Pseudoxanthomonas indica]|uniref:Anti sigma-E protein, RseA n=1 Tax=Pseudoxanthomonas indica TaxID=428993 RepID=A0A1T5LUU3_9GAMM|nr:sigma-E factor negative regulatory protein [Pseudoxanthomonas indica]GGD39710.1 hypothetical protein GCM10007235_09710 [Pseudoxanthomonas indica]SKC79624.1 anti sigma-E protein, RseA [Pseudoxanthomonas indica]